MSPKSFRLNEFLSLRCAGDVINAVAPLRNPCKEISESMAVVRRLKPFFLQRPMELCLVDACAGNALTGILAVHLLPVCWVRVMDREPRRRPGHVRVKRLDYVEHTFGDVARDVIRAGSCRWWPGSVRPAAGYILTATHPCGTASTLVDIYRQDERCVGLVMLLCCKGQLPITVPQAVVDKIGKYEAWALSLAIAAGGTYYRDARCLSPMNAVVVASKDARRSNDVNA